MGTALVVEDSLTDVKILSSCLQRGGINVLIAQSGEEALTKITSYTPDVIILDIVLPGCSGFELCRELKADNSTSSIPIVMCSTKKGEMDKLSDFIRRYGETVKKAMVRGEGESLDTIAEIHKLKQKHLPEYKSYMQQNFSKIYTEPHLPDRDIVFNIRAYTYGFLEVIKEKEAKQKFEENKK